MTKEEQYAKLSLDTCLDLAKAMSMDVTRDSIIQQLILNPDVKSVSENLVNKYQLTGKFNFEEDGYDEGLVEVLYQKYLRQLISNLKNLKIYKQMLHMH